MNAKKKALVTTFFDIFGYSFVGIISYYYGLVLQNHNIQNGLIVELESYGEYSVSIILISVFQILLTLLFGFSYATVFFNKSEIFESRRTEALAQKNIYGVIGRWIETILVCVTISVCTCWLINPALFKIHFLFIVFVLAIPFVFGSVCYRFKAYDIFAEKTENGGGGDITDENEDTWLYKAKYVLVFPAMLMIGENVYVGASVYKLLQGEIIYYVPIVIFVLFLICLCVSDNRTFERCIYVLFSVILLLVGIGSYFADYDIPCKNMFLAVMTAVFLSVFECWYIVFRQLKDAKNKAFVKVESYIILGIPPVVFALYPIQNFNAIYFISCCVGMLVMEFMWFIKIVPNIDISRTDEKFPSIKRQTAFSRAFLGIITLLFLTLDKYAGEAMNFKIVSSEGSGEAFSVSGLIVAIIAIILEIVLLIYKNKFQRIKEFLPRYIGYMFVIIILFAEKSYYPDLDISKHTMSIIALSAFLILDGICFVRAIKNTKEG